MIQPLRTERAEDFGSLFATYQQPAYRLALLLCGERSLAEDAVSSAFLSVYPHWMSGRVEEFWPYLRTAVTRQVHGVFRKREVERREERRWRVQDNPGRPFDATTVDLDALRHALAALPAQQRAVVVLRYYQDLSEAETASILEVSVGTVKTQASRGLGRLRASLEGGDVT